VSTEVQKLSRAEKLFEQGDIEQSLQECLDYLTDHQGDTSALRLKAKLQGARGDLNDAIDSIGLVIRLSKSPEPCDSFYLGRWRLRNGEIENSITDFEQVLELSARYQNDYYADAAHLHLAYAYAMRSQIAEAESHLKYLGVDSITSINDSIINAQYIRKLIDVNS
jgi:tetratricopeptide (TPR) repeat protein